MYVGRFVVVGPEVAAYRVSSRSFPNRRITERDGSLTVVPTEDAGETDNPYISYNCVRTVEAGGETAVLGNGSHVDPITEKLGMGYPARDALAESLLALDYEKDDYDTPRVAGVLGESAYIGVVRKDALLVREVEEPTLVATYEENAPTPYAFGATDARAAAEEAYGAAFEHAVCAAGVGRTPGGVEFAIENGE
jgi:IMP cyclohydrolase